MPPAASIFSRALRVKASATMKSGRPISPPPEDLDRLAECADEAGGAEQLGVDRQRCGLVADDDEAGVAMAASASAKRPCSAYSAIRPTLTTS